MSGLANTMVDFYICEMEEKVPIVRLKVKPQYAPEMNRLLFEYLCTKGERDGLVYNFINTHPEMTISEMHNYLRNNHEPKIHASYEGIERIIDWCNLPYAGRTKKDKQP